MPKITIPAINELPFEKAEEWAKDYFRRVQIRASSKRIKKVKEWLPIETADYAVKMTIGLWRLIGPTKGCPDKEAPLAIVLDFAEPYIIKSKWGQFKPKLTKQLRLAFTAICNSNYNPEMVKEMNNDINDLLTKLVQGAVIRFEFILHSETAESYDSLRILGIRSKIWEHFTGKPLDLNLYPTNAVPIPGRPIQMEMHLDISVIVGASS
jgi:hypothetical protein